MTDDTGESREVVVLNLLRRAGLSQAFVDWLAEHDAKVRAQERHEHGERIADAVMPKLVDVYGTNGFPVRLLRQALGYVISPAPKKEDQ